MEEDRETVGLALAQVVTVVVAVVDTVPQTLIVWDKEGEAEVDKETVLNVEGVEVGVGVFELEVEAQREVEGVLDAQWE